MRAGLNEKRVAVLYGSQTKLSNAHKLVSSHGMPKNGGERQPEYYVRMKTFRTFMNELSDVQLPQPKAGETLLNWIWL